MTDPRRAKTEQNPAVGGIAVPSWLLQVVAYGSLGLGTTTAAIVWQLRDASVRNSTKIESMEKSVNASEERLDKRLERIEDKLDKLIGKGSP